MVRVLIGGALALLVAMYALGSSSPFDAGSPTSEASSVAVAQQPTPTYVSELAPAVMQPPRESVALPASGAGAAGEAMPWARLGGVALALAGCAMVWGGLAMRRATA